MKHGGITAHGFRSTFRDWAAERTTFAREVAEMALAHAIPDAVEAAYRRGDLFEKRRKLMDAWATYCAKIETDAGKVVALVGTSRFLPGSSHGLVNTSIKQFCATAKAKYEACLDLDQKREWLKSHIEKVIFSRVVA